MIVLSPDERVLLFYCVDDELYFDPARPGVSEYWNTPGGGIDLGETVEEAAERELFEETGISNADIGPQLWLTDRVIRFPQRDVRFLETYVLVRTATTDVSFATLQPLERRWLRSHRWWTPAELHETHDAVIPAQLAMLVEPLLRGDYPAAPYVLPI